MKLRHLEYPENPERIYTGAEPEIGEYRPPGVRVRTLLVLLTLALATGIVIGTLLARSGFGELWGPGPK